VLLILFLLSVAGGLFSGFLGIGGAVVLIPLMLEVPPLVGAGALTMHQVAAITMVQVLAASITGYFAHRRSGLAHTGVILAVGGPMGVFALLGAVLSKSLSSATILAIFGCLVAAAFIMLLAKTPEASAGEDIADFRFSIPLSLSAGTVVGLAAGIVGAGGGFVIVPVMIRVLRMPVKVAVGSSLGIVVLGALMGSIGKILTLQVPWEYLPPIIGGSIPASLLGAWATRRIPGVHVKRTLTLVVLLVLLKTWKDILFGGAGIP